jgi:hypothetical protein
MLKKLQARGLIEAKEHIKLSCTCNKVCQCTNYQELEYV